MTQQQQQSQKSKNWMLRTFAFVAIGAFILPIEASNHIKASIEAIETGKKIESVAIRTEGKLLASASGDNTVKLWDSTTGKETKTLSGHTNWVYNYLASASDDNTVKLWDAGEEVRTLNKHSSTVRSVSFSPNGQIIASAGDDKTVKLWNADTGEQIQTLNGHSSKVWSVEFSPDGKTIASASDDKTVKLWDINGRAIKTLKRHSDSVNSVIFSPDSKILATASSDKTIKLWNRDGKLLHTLKGDNAKFTNLSFCPNGQEIVSAGTDNKVKLWSVDSGKLLTTFAENPSSIDGLDCSPDSKTIGAASKDGTVVLWSRDGKESKIFRVNKQNLQRPQIFFTVKNTPETKADAIKKNIVRYGGSTTFAPLSRYVVVQKMPSTKIIHIATHGTFDNKDTNFSASVMSLDGNTTAYAKGTEVYIHGTRQHTLKHSVQVSSIDLNPKGNTIVTGCVDGTLNLWDLNNGKFLRGIKAHNSEVKKIDYSDDGQIITSQSNASITRRWNSDLSSNETKFLTVIFVAFFGFFGSAALLFVVIKRRKNRKHNNTSNPKKNYIITGWVNDIFPEDWIANLEALRYELIATNKPKWYVRLITVTTLMDMLCGGIQVKLQNFYDGDDLIAAIGRRSITDDRDNSIDE